MQFRFDAWQGSHNGPVFDKLWFPGIIRPAYNYLFCLGSKNNNA